MRRSAAAADRGADASVSDNPNARAKKPARVGKPPASRREGRGRVEAPAPPPTGLAARELAVDLIAAVLQDHRALDETLANLLKSPAYRHLETRDLGMARTIAANTLRYAQPLDEVVGRHIEKPLPAKQGRVAAILLSAATQMLILKTPAHAAINLAVDQTRLSRQSTHLAKFVNAVLRKVSVSGSEDLAMLDLPRSAIPPWLFQRWASAYGDEQALAIAKACLIEAPLDLTLKEPCRAAEWAERLGGATTATGSLRLSGAGRVDELPGFSEGAWWVQDAAAALPARLLGDANGLGVADLCAAPGGKTAQLAASGANVVAVDQAASRLARVSENLARLNLKADLVEADAASWQPGRTFDAVLLDAPCTATGTIRRHPDILHLKRESDVAALATLQERLLANAATLVRPGGLLVYCTCSLQPEEGEEQAARFLDAHPDWECLPVTPGESGIEAAWLTPEGYLRPLPSQTPAFAGCGPEAPSDPPAASERPAQPGGMDGFFAARFRRKT